MYLCLYAVLEPHLSIQVLLSNDFKVSMMIIIILIIIVIPFYIYSVVLSCKHSKINCFFILNVVTDLPELASKFSAVFFYFVVDINFCLKIILFLSFITSLDCKKKSVF